MTFGRPLLPVVHGECIGFTANDYIHFEIFAPAKDGSSVFLKIRDEMEKRLEQQKLFPVFKESKLKESNKLIISKEFVEELKAEQRLKDTLDYQIKLAKYKEDNFIYLPLIFNHEKLQQIGKKLDNILTHNNPQILLKSEQLRVGSKSRKIHIIFNYEEKSNLGNIIENSLFVAPDEDNTIAFDVNLKNNLLADSNGQFYDEIFNINKSNFLDNLNEIVLLQSIEVEKRTEKQKYRYEKLLRANESLLKTYLSGLVKDWKSQDITHLVLEDLNLIGDKSYYEHQNVKIKYSRLARLLRLSQIKLWVSQMTEKQGLFTHLVNSAYTSQECSKCHFISSLNRVKQESFKCTNKNCHHEMNADTNSALNIKARVLHKELRAKLNKDNVYLCSRPKPIYYRNVKNVIDEVYKSGVVTELFPENMISRIQSKEASPFRAG